jgi:hypothetical protein
MVASSKIHISLITAREEMGGIGEESSGGAVADLEEQQEPGDRRQQWIERRGEAVGGGQE